MKKLLILLYLLLSSILPIKILLASNSFARINSSYAYLYTRADSKIEDNVICYLEESYFVEITLDYNADFYKVNYNGISGYVLKNNVTRVIGIPKKPFPTTNIISGNSKCYLRSSPKTDEDNIVTIIPANCSDLNYIGKIYGEEAIDYQGSLWYMVSYFGVQGYVYSKYITTISSIALNTETLEPYASNLSQNPSPLDNIECAMIILILSIPIVLIVFIMYKKPMVKQSKPSRKLPKAKKKIDYDELL